MANQQYGQTYGQTYQQPYMNQPQGFNNFNPQMMQYGQGNMPFTKEAMCKLPQFKNANASTMAGAIIAYISAVVTLILIIAEEMDPMSLIDVIIVALLGVIIHRTKSFGPSVVLLVYGIVSCIVTTLTMGVLSGWLLIIGGIAAVIGSNKISKAWKNYERTGMIPAMPV
jgi:ABC-type multidrug transport system fused ATPase/permease subunit